MLQIKAKIKPSSQFYTYGLNHKRQSVWLPIKDFKPMGKYNYLLTAVKDISGTNIIFIDIWVSIKDVTLKQFEDNQLALFPNDDIQPNENF